MRLSVIRLFRVVLAAIIAMIGVAPRGRAQSSHHAQAQAATKAKPFYLGSTYDRFSERHNVLLFSRGAITSNQVELNYAVECRPGGPCEELIVRLAYILPAHPSAAQQALFDKLREGIVCLQMLFHGTDGDARDTACFRTRAAPLGKTGKMVVMGLDDTANLYAAAFRAASSVEMRLQGTEITWTIPQRELRKFDAFWAEFDRRHALGPS